MYLVQRIRIFIQYKQLLSAALNTTFIFMLVTQEKKTEGTPTGNNKLSKDRTWMKLYNPNEADIIDQ